MLNSSEVTIVDIRMPFGSMVLFMVKAALAAIPAMIILAILYVGFAAIAAIIRAGAPEVRPVPQYRGPIRIPLRAQQGQRNQRAALGLGRQVFRLRQRRPQGHLRGAGSCDGQHRADAA